VLGPGRSSLQGADEVIERGADPLGQVAALERYAGLPAERAQVGRPALSQKEGRQVEPRQDRIAEGSGPVKGVPCIPKEDLGLVLLPGERRDQPLDAHQHGPVHRRPPPGGALGQGGQDAAPLERIVQGGEAARDPPVRAGSEPGIDRRRPQGKHSIESRHRVVHVLQVQMDGGEVGERQGLIARLAGAAEQGGGALEERHRLIETPLVAAQPGEPPAILGVFGRIDALPEMGNGAHEGVFRLLQAALPAARFADRAPGADGEPRLHACAGPFPVEPLGNGRGQAAQRFGLGRVPHLAAPLEQPPGDEERPVAAVLIEARVPLLPRQSEQLGGQGLGLPPFLLDLSGGAPRPLGQPVKDALVEGGLRERRGRLTRAPAQRAWRQRAPTLPGTARTLQQVEHETRVGDGQGLQEDAQNRQFWMVHRRGPPSPPPAGNGMPA
jgi:hypothetical protein